MSKGTVNKAFIIGRLGNDPNLRYTPSGVPCATFSLATNESWKNDDGNEKVQTDWHHIVAWRKLGEICQQYLKKGSLVCIEGKMRTRSWEKDGQKHNITEIIAENMQMLGGGPKQESGDGKIVTPPPMDEAEPNARVSDDLPF